MFGDLCYYQLSLRVIWLGSMHKKKLQPVNITVLVKHPGSLPCFLGLSTPSHHQLASGSGSLKIIVVTTALSKWSHTYISGCKHQFCDKSKQFMLCFLEVTAKLKWICFIYGYWDMYFLNLAIFLFPLSARAQSVDVLLIHSPCMRVCQERSQLAVSLIFINTVLF